MEVTYGEDIYKYFCMAMLDLSLWKTDNGNQLKYIHVCDEE